MKTIKHVIFDFGGVIGLPQSEQYIQEMIRLTGVSREELLPLYFERRLDYDQGLTDTTTYWHQILDKHHVKLTDELIAKLLVADASSWTQINDKTIGYIKKLKQEGIHIVLLSNINYGALDFIEKKFDFLDLFDQKFYSCEMKLLKPDVRIYTEVIRSLEVDASECLFIDDSLDNVKGAKASGMESEQFIDFELLMKKIDESYSIESIVK